MTDAAGFHAAIAAQPDWMARAAVLARDALAAHPIAPWRPAETVAVLGMGASTHAGAVFVEALRQAGQRAVNLDASAVAHYPAGFPVAEHVLVLSESGRSPEPIAAVERLAVRPIVVTNDPASPLARLGAVVVPLGGFTDSGVYTVGYTTTLVALAALAAAGGVPLADPAGLAGVAATALAECDAPAHQFAAALDRCAFLDLVGQGVAYGSAQAAALLLREAAHLPTAPYETLQYLHGPMECDGPASAVLLFGERRERALADQLAQAGVLVHRLAADPGYAGAITQIVFAQLVAADLAARRGLDVGRWRYPQTDTKLPASA